MRLLIPMIATTTFMSLQACNELPSPSVAPGPFVAEELLGTWRVVAIYDDNTGTIDPVYEDGLNVSVTYSPDSLQIHNGCSPAERALYANYGLYEVLAVVTDHIDTCSHGSDEQLYLFDIANPNDGYYHIIEDRLHLFNLRGDLRVTLIRIP